jgi:hypothetical protein
MIPTTDQTEAPPPAKRSASDALAQALAEVESAASREIFEQFAHMAGLREQTAGGQQDNVVKQTSAHSGTDEQVHDKDTDRRRKAGDTTPQESKKGKGVRWEGEDESAAGVGDLFLHAQIVGARTARDSYTEVEAFSC